MYLDFDFLFYDEYLGRLLLFFIVEARNINGLYRWEIR